MHFQEARLFKRLTTKEIAKAVGVGETTICHWQKGTTIPTIQQKRAVATALGMATKDIDYGEPPGGFRRRLVRKAGPTGRAAAKAKAAGALERSLDDLADLDPGPATQTKTRRIAAEAAARDKAEATEVPLIKGRIEPNGRLGITGGTFEVVSGPAPEAFDSSTWSVIRRMIETIGVDEAIRRLMLVR